MSLEVSFVYYRRFQFDGMLHVRCMGSDLHKVKHIIYVLERAEADGPVYVDTVTVPSQAHSGVLSDHGCPATFVTEGAAGTYTITPKITLTDKEIIARDLPGDVDGIQVMGPLVFDIKEGEATRHILDSVPLSASTGRRKRSVGEARVSSPTCSERVDASGVYDPYGDSLEGFPYVEQGKTYPPLVLKFREDGVGQLLLDLGGVRNFVFGHNMSKRCMYANQKEI